VIPLLQRAGRLRFHFRLLAFVVVIGICAVTAKATPSFQQGDPFVFEFDDNGNGSLNINKTGAFPDTGQLLPDPTQPGHPLVLTYFLPYPVGTGDMNIFIGDTDIVGAGLRFTDDAGDPGGFLGERMIYYSLAGTNPLRPALADVLSLPANWYPTTVTRQFNGEFYFPPSGAGGNVYHGHRSTNAPEPSTLTLAALGSLALLAFCRRRRR
jgi:MYXO-CTERM domain-containing protein